MWLRVLLKTLFISAAMTTDNHETMSISTSTRPEIIAGLLSMQMKRSSIARGDEALPRDYPPGGGGGVIYKLTFVLHRFSEAASFRLGFLQTR